MKKTCLLGILLVFIAPSCDAKVITTPNHENTNPETPDGLNLTYRVVSTGQTKAYNNSTNIELPDIGEEFYGQNANHIGTPASYTDNGDGTITDHITNLVWEKDFQVMGYEEAFAKCPEGWRLPSIKEAYSLIMFYGKDVDPNGSAGSDPFINTTYFDFEYGANGDRIIDSQMLTSTIYVGLTMRADKTVFGVNFADGRIKGYPLEKQGTAKLFMVRYVKGEVYGMNEFIDNNDGTISDKATGLMWSKEDSGLGMNWKEALAYVEQLNQMRHLGYSDWRLPDVKELHTIVDYTRSPQTSASAAIDPIFKISSFTNEGGRVDFPYFWSSTTHENVRGGSNAAYFAFGEALGYMIFGGQQSGQRRQKQRANGSGEWLDVHGAGAQRSDPKIGEPSIFGPQGDVRRIENHVRIVRNIEK